MNLIEQYHLSNLDPESLDNDRIGRKPQESTSYDLVMTSRMRRLSCNGSIQSTFKNPSNPYYGRVDRIQTITLQSFPCLIGCFLVRYHRYSAMVLVPFLLFPFAIF